MSRLAMAGSSPHITMLGPGGQQLAPSGGPQYSQQFAAQYSQQFSSGPPTVYSPDGRNGPQQQPLVVAAMEQALADPVMRQAVKQHAKEIGGYAAVAAQHYGHKGLMAFQDYIQQGPQGISMLCFVGGAATSTIGFMNVCSFFGGVLDPFHYILNGYMFVFGIVTACIEADPDSVGMLLPPFDRLAEPITQAQAYLHNEWKFLTRLRGRGLFYLYQGMLMVTQCIFCLMFLAGLYNALMGIVCIMVSFGIQPDIEGIAASAGLGPPSKQYALVDEEEGPVKSGVAATGFEGEYQQAESTWKQNKDRIPGKLSRELWALSKQATVGDCNVDKPSGMFNGGAKEQWRLWNGLAGITQDEAKSMFIERLRKADIET